jgi:hypothetical protein
MIYTFPVRSALTLLTVTFVAFCCLDANANSCGPLKRLNVKHVCGVVVDGSEKPIPGATLQLVSAGGESVSPRVSTGSDGRFYIDGAHAGNVLLSIEAPQHNSGKWPLKVTASTGARSCKKPLKVHLAGCLGCACGDWVSKE